MRIQETEKLGQIPVTSRPNKIWYEPFWNTGTRKACWVTVLFRYLQLHALVHPYSALPAAQTCSSWITTPRCWNSSWSTELVANLWHGRESHCSLTTLNRGSQANPTVLCQSMVDHIKVPGKSHGVEPHDFCELEHFISFRSFWKVGIPTILDGYHHCKR